MKIIIVGASGTIGKHLIAAFKKDHEIVTVGSKSGDIQADVTSTDSIEKMYQQAGAFDALVSLAGPAHVGPLAAMTANDFRKGLEGKLLGQVNLVLIGQKYINAKGSFTLTSGSLAVSPELYFANVSTVNGAINSFVKAAAIELANGVRINSISPTVVEDSKDYFPYFPGTVPAKMEHVTAGYIKSVLGSGTGQVIQIH